MGPTEETRGRDSLNTSFVAFCINNQIVQFQVRLHFTRRHAVKALVSGGKLYLARVRVGTVRVNASVQDDVLEGFAHGAAVAAVVPRHF